jgi:hypothetical protein
MRLLLLYGVWVTVLYGAFRAVVDLTAAAGRAGYSFCNTAADLIYGTSSQRGSSSSSSSAEHSTDTAGADEHGQGMGDPAAVHGPLPSTPAVADINGATAGAGAGASSSTDSGSSFPRAANRHTNGMFDNMLPAVLPVYLMLLGSVSFFASM